ncbi:hypothetical protein [Flavobacterium sp.]|uniref:hypothetical protein n=1 Tax=Flavobacterium sp. TaxID=239 RepID=UPI0037C09A59
MRCYYWNADWKGLASLNADWNGFFRGWLPMAISIVRTKELMIVNWISLRLHTKSMTQRNMVYIDSR